MNAEELQEKIAHLHELKKNFTKNLRVLEQQAARFGLHVPPYIQIEINDVKEKIQEIDHSMQQLEQPEVLTEIENMLPTIGEAGVPQSEVPTLPENRVRPTDQEKVSPIGYTDATIRRGEASERLELSSTTSPIIVYLQRCNLTKRDLAHAIGVSPKTVETWEKGGVPKRENLLRMMEVFCQKGAMTTEAEAIQFWQDVGRGQFKLPSQELSLIAGVRERHYGASDPKQVSLSLSDNSTPLTIGDTGQSSSTTHDRDSPIESDGVNSGQVIEEPYKFWYGVRRPVACALDMVGLILLCIAALLGFIIALLPFFVLVWPTLRYVRNPSISTRTAGWIGLGQVSIAAFIVIRLMFVSQTNYPAWSLCIAGLLLTIVGGLIDGLGIFLKNP